MEELLKKAESVGYIKMTDATYNHKLVFLDPKFFQALGKACNWEVKDLKVWWERQSLGDKIVLLEPWENMRHTFIYTMDCQGWDKAVEWLAALIK